MLTPEIKASIDNSVLCWLATCSKDHVPNVSPKEVFCAYGEDEILIANIASPQSVRNVKENSVVCVSFIDILVQKGFQLKGQARVIYKIDDSFPIYSLPLTKIATEKFPFKSLIAIKVEKSKPIIAPSYLFYPQTSEEEQIRIAIETYGFNKL